MSGATLLCRHCGQPIALDEDSRRLLGELEYFHTTAVAPGDPYKMRCAGNADTFAEPERRAAAGAA